MKTLILLLLVSLSCFSQVGIGTITPQATLHIADDGMPERVIFENVPHKPSAGRYLVIDGDDELGWNDGSNLILRPNINNVRELPNIEIEVPSLTAGVFTLDNIPLISLNVNIQPNSTTFFVLNYNVPIRVKSGNNNIGTDMGVRFYRNGLFYDWASNEQTLSRSINGLSRNGVTFINGTYYEAIFNSSATAMTLTFTIEGWIDQAYSGDINTIYSFDSDMKMTYQSTSYQN